MKVVIYSRTNCTYCTRAKDFFRGKNIEYQEVQVGQDITTEEYTELTSMKSVPAIFINDELIGGYTDLVEYAVDNSEMFDV